jgi:hypothetical protein
MMAYISFSFSGGGHGLEVRRGYGGGICSFRDEMTRELNLSNQIIHIVYFFIAVRLMKWESRNPTPWK